MTPWLCSVHHSATKTDPIEGKIHFLKMDFLLAM